MKDFHYYAPTEVAFGINSLQQLIPFIKKYALPGKILLHYGRSSAVSSGLLSSIENQLQEGGLNYISLGGVQPNPRLSLVREGIALCRKEGVGLILAVGGGSVIDSSKAIGYGTLYDGDVWDFYIGKSTPTNILPVGCVLTIAAAGSEMSDATVISNEDTKQKFGYCNDIGRAKFAIMNPALTMSLPPFQTACGAVDIMMHTMERYFTKDTDMLLRSAMSEALLRTVKEAADTLLCRHPSQAEAFQARSAIMWASSISHNDLLGTRQSSDFASHKIEHELSALFDVAHGAGLSAIWPFWARYVMNENPQRFADFATKVMGVQPAENLEQTALKGIEAMEDCYRRWNMPIGIKALLGQNLPEETLSLMADKCTIGDSFHPGYFKSLTKSDIFEIYRMANY